MLFTRRQRHLLLLLHTRFLPVLLLHVAGWPTASTMASNSAYPSTHYLNPSSDDFKASYDDLVHDFSTPYSKSPTHHTAVIDPSNASPSHRRAPSYPLTHNPSYSATDIASTEEGGTRKGGIEWGYPPVTQKVADKGPALSFWARVGHYRVPIQPLSPNLPLAHARFHGLPAIRYHCSHRDDDRLGHRRRPARPTPRELDITTEDARVFECLRLRPVRLFHRVSSTCRSFFIQYFPACTRRRRRICPQHDPIHLPHVRVAISVSPPEIDRFAHTASSTHCSSSTPLSKSAKSSTH